MSISLLLEEYLATMKEDRELDALLPQLLSAMGHRCLSLPQRGVRQSGVDIVSVGYEGGKKKLFLWVIKCGDIDRSAWSGNPQAVRESLQDIVDVFLESNLQPAQKRLPKKIYIVTNGNIKQETDQQMSGYLAKYERTNELEVETVNGSVLASWAQEYLFNEYILPKASQSLMRRALANVESPSIAITHARELIDSLLNGLSEISGAPKTRIRKILAQLRAVTIFNSVLFVWSRQADNLECAYLSTEYALIAAWSALHEDRWLSIPEIAHMVAQYTVDYLLIASHYHNKFTPYYYLDSAFSYALHENCLVVERVFEEIGRLGAAAMAFSTLTAVSTENATSRKAEELCDHLIALLNTHSVSGSPCYDNQTVDISCGMAALVVNNRNADAKQWLLNLIGRLGKSKQFNRYTPLSSDSFDDLVAIRFEHLKPSPDQLNLSTLIPALAFWCGILNAEQEYRLLVDRVAPLFKETTLNLWYCGADYESELASPNRLHESGYGATMELPKEMSDLANVLQNLPSELPDLNKFQFIKQGSPWISLLASRHWHLQLPHDLVFKTTRQLASVHKTQSSSPSTTFS